MIKEFRSDINDLRPIADAWKAECNGEGFALEADPDELLREFYRLSNVGNGCELLVQYRDGKPVGIMGLTIFKSPIGKDRICNEHFWYVLPEHRGIGSLKMLDAAVEWAKKKGCTHFMANASKLASDLHDSVCKIYERKGMKHFETTYLMEV